MIHYVVPQYISPTKPIFKTQSAIECKSTIFKYIYWNTSIKNLNKIKVPNDRIWDKPELTTIKGIKNSCTGCYYQDKNIECRTVRPLVFDTYCRKGLIHVEKR